MAEYKVSVEKDYLVFCAGHFITYTGTCETLHGHNYRARLEVEGELDEDSYVWDFVSLKRMMRRLVDELDHRMLLPRDNPSLQVTEEGDGIQVLYKERRYVFPRSDVVLIPIPNTTAEMLARYLLGRVKVELQAAGAGRLSALAVEVEESFGQSGWCRERMRD
ncbi:MAG: 6-pyruvoyl trahydropterin synthase family protein [Candidatus Rokuibacteriota bacterium]|jgi:6-pyruvoyltetrahydropterin/6-carboxytetrahydropterin synthase